MHSTVGYMKVASVNGKATVFFDPALEALYNEGKLIKLEPNETNKLIRFQRNPEYDPNG